MGCEEKDILCPEKIAAATATTHTIAMIMHIITETMAMARQGSQHFRRAKRHAYVAMASERKVAMTSMLALRYVPF